MEHKVSVLIRLDMDNTRAVLEVGGCLTEGSCQALFPLIRRAASLVAGLDVTVDLLTASHIEEPALEQLEEFGAGTRVDMTSPDGQGFAGSIHIIAPPVLPLCEAVRASQADTENLAGSAA